MLEILDFPRFEENGMEYRMHFSNVNDEQVHLLMDPNKVGGDASGDPDPNDLEFNHQTFYTILCKTLCPTV